MKKRAREKVRRELAEAIGDDTMRRIERRPKGADRIDGFVLAVGRRWVLVAQCSEGGYPDGHIAARIKDVVRVRRDRTFESRFARTLPSWPPSVPADNLDLSSTRGVLRTLVADKQLVAIQRERKVASGLWIGRIDEVEGKWLWLAEVSPRAKWYRPRGYKLGTITTIEVGGAYMDALAQIAGEPDHEPWSEA